MLSVWQSSSVDDMVRVSLCSLIPSLDLGEGVVSWLHGVLGGSPILGLGEGVVKLLLLEVTPGLKTGGDFGG